MAREPTKGPIMTDGRGFVKSGGGESSGFTSLQYKFACDTIRKLKKHKQAGPFIAPVDAVALGIPHYTNIITKPMDLTTIDRKLFVTVPGQSQPLEEESSSATRYTSVDDWVDDVNQVFQNTYIFNGPDHPVSKMAQALEAAFSKEMKRFPSADDSSLSVAIPGNSPFSGPPSAVTPDDSQDRSQTSTPYLQNNLPLPPMAGKPGDALAEQFKFCGKVLDTLYKQDYVQFAWWFYDPVREADIPGYHATIKNPMSMAVMRQKLDNNEYADPSGFKADFDQIIWNCNKYNPVGSVAQDSARRLKEIFDKKWKNLPRGPKAGAGKTLKLSKGHQGSTPKPGDRTSLEGAGSRRGSIIASSPHEAGSARSTMPPPDTFPAANNIKPPVVQPSPLPSTPPLAQPIRNSPAAAPARSAPLAVPEAPPRPIVLKRKSEQMTAPAEPATSVPRDGLGPREQLKLARTIHKLKGAQLEQAVEMIQDGIANTPRCQNASGDAEFEVASLPSNLVRELYITFVGPLPNKRPKRAAAERALMDYSDSD